LEQYGIDCVVEEPDRIASFPPCCSQKEIVPLCSGAYRGRSVGGAEWIELNRGNGKLLWTPGRMQSNGENPALSVHLHELMSPAVIFPEDSCRGWRFRVFKSSSGGTVIHGLADRFDVEVMHELEEQRKNRRGNHIISTITQKNATPEVCVELHDNFQSALFHAPLASVMEKVAICDKKIRVVIPEHIYYFILELDFNKIE
jgi:hypothetical protein